MSAITPERLELLARVADAARIDGYAVLRHDAHELGELVRGYRAYLAAERELAAAIELAEEGWSYAGDYFREKWDYEGRIGALKRHEAADEMAALQCELAAAREVVVAAGMIPHEERKCDARLDDALRAYDAARKGEG